MSFEMDDSVMSAIETMITNNVIEMGFKKEDIGKCFEDVKQRLSWRIGSYNCRIYCRRNQIWTEAHISDIFIDKKTNKEWLKIKYFTKHTKDIQRFSPFIKPDYDLNANMIKIIAKELNNYNVHIARLNAFEKTWMKTYGWRELNPIQFLKLLLSKENDALIEALWESVYLNDQIEYLIFGFIKWQIAAPQNISYANIVQLISMYIGPISSFIKWHSAAQNISKNELENLKYINTLLKQYPLILKLYDIFDMRALDLFFYWIHGMGFHVNKKSAIQAISKLLNKEYTYDNNHCKYHISDLWIKALMDDFIYTNIPDE